MDDDGQQDYDVTFYPPGGAFNKLRTRQTFFENLIEANWKEYSQQPTTTKKDFIRANILDPIQFEGGTVRIFRGSHPDRGELVTPDNNEATDLVAQKLRDMKKRRLLARSTISKAAQAKRPPSSRPPSSRPKQQSSNVRVEYQDENNTSDKKTKSGGQFVLDEASGSELKTIVLSQWDHIDDWRRLCASQKETIEKLTLVNSRQHEMLATLEFDEETD